MPEYTWRYLLVSSYSHAIIEDNVISVLTDPEECDILPDRWNILNLADPMLWVYPYHSG